jgi:predicted nuclease with RNAse H fold
MTVVGIDVGGKKKGFHGCALDGREIVAGPLRLRTVEAAVAWVAALRPTTVALDSPCEPATDGDSSRADERTFNAAKICHIRWTPERKKLRGAYYAWIVHGLELYDALAAALADQVPAAELIEVFPTASWTEWIGPRNSAGAGGSARSRAAWTTAGIERLGRAELDLTDLAQKTGKPRLNQDDRDAIAAALTARLHEEGRTTAYGRIIVPAGPLP